MPSISASPVRLSTSSPSFEADFARRLFWSSDADAAIEQRVRDILADVQVRGDAAVLEYTRRFDRVHAPSVAALELSQTELKSAFDSIAPARRRALEAAAQRVRTYHEAQKKACGESWSYHDEHGSLLGQKVTPLDRVGIYVPGGKAAYPSSVLMNAIPAQVAGVAEIIMVVPTPAPADGSPPPVSATSWCWRPPGWPVSHACSRWVVPRRWQPWLTGRKPCPRSTRLPGPAMPTWRGQAARFWHGRYRHDRRAERNPGAGRWLDAPDWVAMDLFSQAEHDELAQSILLCPDAAYIDAVQASIDRLLPGMLRREIIAASLNGPRCAGAHAQHDEACQISNRVAPEHLEVSSREPQRWEPMLRHAGAIFLGAYTSESLGDYCAGPNHVLPTARLHGSPVRWASTISRNAAA